MASTFTTMPMVGLSAINRQLVLISEDQEMDYSGQSPRGVASNTEYANAQVASAVIYGSEPVEPVHNRPVWGVTLFLEKLKLVFTCFSLDALSRCHFPIVLCVDHALHDGIKHEINNLNSVSEELKFCFEN